MPQGNWIAGRRARAGGMALAMRPALALSVLAALAACAQSGGREAPPRGVASHGSHYNRPASYDPPGPSHDPWGPWMPCGPCAPCSPFSPCAPGGPTSP